jgi:cytoskeletal protein CcmA (bactofilin family)
MKRRIVDALFSVGPLAWWLLFGCSGLPAAEFRAEDQSVVESDEIVEDDLYIFGDEVTIDGVVKGDVIAFGRLIKLNGSVEGDFVAAGQAIVISGKVADDVRIAGQVLKIDKQAAITDDLIAAGFSLEFMEAGSIDGDLVYAGYQALVGGDVAGKVKGGLVNCEISGRVGGDVELSVGGDPAGANAYTSGSPPPVSMPNVPEGLTIRDTAQIDGALKYQSQNEANIASDAQITGEISHTRPQIQAQQAPTPAERALRIVAQYSTLLIIGLCVVMLAPNWTRRMSDNISTRPLACLAFGAAAIIAVIVLLPCILVLMIALAVIFGVVNLTSMVPVVIVLGLSGGAMLVVSFWFFATYLAEIVLSFFAGSWLLRWAQPTLGENRFLSLLAGLVLLAIISSVPYLGSIVGWLVVLFGLGALVVWLFSKRPVNRRSPVRPQLADG